MNTRKQGKASSGERGYTFIDLAMAMAVFGLLLAGVASAARVYMKDKQLTDSREHARVVARAVENYVLEQGRFPCPAAINTDLNAANYGRAAGCSSVAGGVVSYGGTAGNMTGGIWYESDESDATRLVMRGGIPFIDLNLPEFYAYDGHGNRLFYVITGALTQRKSFDRQGGGITVQSMDGNSRKNHFLVFSAGANEDGAWSRYGRQIKPCGVGIDSENCNTASDSRAIYSAARYSTATGADAFDDIVVNNSSMALPLWKMEDEKDGNNISTIDDGKRIVINSASGTIAADPVGLAGNMSVDVAGAARAETAYAENFCLHNSGTACFEPAIIMDNSRHELDCNTTNIHGIANSAARCRAQNTLSLVCGPRQYFVGLNADGSLICRSFRFTSDNPPTVVTGTCGTANNRALSTRPSSSAQLCSTGLASAVSPTPAPTPDATTWTWTCSGQNNGRAADCIAYKDAPVVTGVCGSSNGQTLSSQPSSNLCASGSASSVSGSGPWNWTCAGSDGGATASCSASLAIPVVNGACGSAHNTDRATPPTTNMCTSGTASVVSGAGPWTWTCSGSGGGSNASCNARKMENGVCGTAHGSVTSTAPTTGFCAVGSASAVSGSGPWTWTCNGINGGSASSTCQATTPPNCGFSANNHTGQMDCGMVTRADGRKSFWCIRNGLAGSAVTNILNCAQDTHGAGTYTFSNNGNYNRLTLPNPETTYCASNGPCLNPSYQCCYVDETPVTGACGPAHGASRSSAPSSATDLCANGTTPTAVSGSGPWQWQCQGLNGAPNSSTCQANAIVHGACGSANGSSMTSAPSSNLCSSGTASAVSGSGPWSWTCNGQNGGASPSCNATVRVNGACGSANGTTVSSAPSSNLCSAGTASAVGGSGPWTWTCAGQNGGSASGTCTANAAPPPIPGACGSANGTTVSSAPSSNLCAQGTASAVGGTGPWTWTCAGQHGGANSGTCTANKTSGPTNGVCGSANNTQVNSAPSAAEMCSSGTPSTISTWGTWYMWTCDGSGGGTTENCGAENVYYTNICKTVGIAEYDASTLWRLDEGTYTFRPNTRYSRQLWTSSIFSGSLNTTTNQIECGWMANVGYVSEPWGTNAGDLWNALYNLNPTTHAIIRKEFYSGPKFGMGP